MGEVKVVTPPSARWRRHWSRRRRRFRRLGRDLARPREGLGRGWHGHRRRHARRHTLSFIAPGRRHPLGFLRDQPEHTLLFLEDVALWPFRRRWGVLAALRQVRQGAAFPLSQIGLKGCEPLLTLEILIFFVFDGLVEVGDLLSGPPPPPRIAIAASPRGAA